MNNKYVIVFFLLYANAAFFYKETSSPFPSGYLETRELEKKITQSKNEYWYRIRAEDKYYWVSADSVVHQKDLFGQVILERNETLYTKPKVSSGKILAKNKYSVCDRHLDWIEICGHGWINSPFLQWDKSLERSYGLTLRATHLFKKPDLLSPQQLLPENLKVQILRETNDFFMVKFFNTIAYAKKEDILNISQFTTGNIYLPQMVVTAKTSLQENKTENIKGEVFATQLEERNIEWRQSSVKGHGLVWWQEETMKPKKESPLFNVKDIMSKKVFDIAKHPQKNLTVVSADGVYRSFDGLTWEKLEKFQDKNFAIAFSPSGDLFVGDSRSQDLGSHFERFVRWDQIMRDLNIRADALDFTIQEIRFESNYLILHVKRRDSDFHIASTDQGKTWHRYQVNANSLIENL